MRFLLPLLTLAAVQPAFAELAVYSGTINTNAGAGSGVPTSTKVTEVIDLETGHFITITLAGNRANFTYLVGLAEQYVIAKGADAQHKAITAFAKVGAGTDEGGAAVETADNLKGRDVAVNLAGTTPSKWPRTLVGAGWLVATPGAAAPSRVQATTTALTLNDAWSKLANDTGSLDAAAESVGVAFRNKIAAGLHYPLISANNPTSPTGSQSSGTGTSNSGGGDEGAFIDTANAFSGFDLSVASGGSFGKLGSGTLTLAGPTSLGGTLTLTGTGTSVTSFAGVTNNYYSGATTITYTPPVDYGSSGATLSLGVSTGALSLNGGVLNTGNLALGASGTSSGSLILSQAPISGGLNTSGGSLNLNLTPVAPST